jgi:octaprenyl-diphosphate synthase
MFEAAPPTLQIVKEPVAQRLVEVEAAIADMVPADYEATDEVNEYILSLRGKLFRPTLLLLANEVGDQPSPKAIRLGAVVELIHVATLVHDDAVDHSVRRRGLPTVNARFSHQVAIIMGDYLYSRAVMEVAQLGDVEPIYMLGYAANRMTVGEMRQLMSHDILTFSEEDYVRLCGCKTAALMAAACELGGLYGAGFTREPLREFGFNLGMAFQITDDLLDYTAPTDMTGKPSGQDLREHKVTLPLIAALREMDPGDRAAVRELFGDPTPGADAVRAIVEAVGRTGGLEYARSRSEEFGDRARECLNGLPVGEPLDALHAAVDFVTQRRS